MASTETCDMNDFEYTTVPKFVNFNKPEDDIKHLCLFFDALTKQIPVTPVALHVQSPAVRPVMTKKCLRRSKSNFTLKNGANCVTEKTRRLSQPHQLKTPGKTTQFNRVISSRPPGNPPSSSAAKVISNLTPSHTTKFQQLEMFKNNLRSYQETTTKPMKNASSKNVDSLTPELHASINRLCIPKWHR